MENIILEDRKKITINGATKVISSTTSQSVVEVGSTNLVIAGENLEVTKLDLENKEVVFSGNIESLKYTKKPTSFFKRIFK
ncbi:MAG: hypothetical protein E7375_00525 [Clostridiales bacterium]|nr:hypothetical protein [Clostridiales bacterium]